jgi:hypothetical protein
LSLDSGSTDCGREDASAAVMNSGLAIQKRHENGIGWKRDWRPDSFYPSTYNLA